MSGKIVSGPVTIPRNPDRMSAVVLAPKSENVSPLVHWCISSYLPDKLIIDKKVYSILHDA